MVMMMQIELEPFDKKYLGFLDRIWKYKGVNKYSGIPSGGIDIKRWHDQYLLSKKGKAFRSEQYIILLDGRPAGEEAFGMLYEAFTFGDWEKDVFRPCSLADIKIREYLWGKGIASEAMRKMIEIIFTSTDSLDIIAIVHKNNSRAKRLFERCGFKDTQKGNIKDNIVYLLSKEGWEDGKD